MTSELADDQEMNPAARLLLAMARLNEHVAECDVSVLDAEIETLKDKIAQLTKLKKFVAASKVKAKQIRAARTPKGKGKGKGKPSDAGPLA